MRVALGLKKRKGRRTKGVFEMDKKPLKSGSGPDVEKNLTRTPFVKVGFMESGWGGGKEEG